MPSGLSGSSDSRLGFWWYTLQIHLKSLGYIGASQVPMGRKKVTQTKAQQVNPRMD